MLNEDLVIVRSTPGRPAGKARLEEVGCLPAWKEEGYPGQGRHWCFWPCERNEISKLRRKGGWESQDIYIGLCCKNKCFWK